MDKTAIKNFAIQARKDLIAGVKQKAYEYGIDVKTTGNEAPTGALLNGRILTSEEQSQRNELLNLIKIKGYDQVMEEGGYTWFNRFIALRFMEVNEYLPSRIRCFTNGKNEFQPEILSEALHLDLNGLDKAKVISLLETNRTEELYKYLLITQCNDLNTALPEMFEKIQNYTELLFPNNLLKEGSVLACMISNIPQEDWKEAVEIIGWLYQYYNTEVKDETFELLSKNVKITKERIPAATQLFTPDWIVRYMVENSLGRLWIEGHPSELLKSNWKYYLEEAEQEPEVVEQLQKIRTDYAKIKPEEIKVIDPCMGSGHILVYAFDVLMQIYIATGYSERDAAKSILKNNLYGLDIDDRAHQLAYFAVMMKARKYCRTIFSAGICPNLYSIQESNLMTQELIEYVASADINIKYDLQAIVETFREAKEYGSILIIPRVNFKRIIDRFQEIKYSQTNDLQLLTFRRFALESLLPIIHQAQIMACQYDVVITNPPYMGNGGMSDKLSEYLKKYYPHTKADMSTVFMEKSISMCNEGGLSSMINIPVWMFISSYEALRNNIIRDYTIINMIHFGRGVFGSDFGTTSFVISKMKIQRFLAKYRKLFLKQGAVDSVEEKEKMFFNNVGIYNARQENFTKIPGLPIAYWVSGKMIINFEKGDSIGATCSVSEGIKTGNNDCFLRYWFEINLTRFSLARSNKNFKWYPHHKGGDFRKWYGNLDWVINWENDGNEIKRSSNSGLQGKNMYFQEVAGWSKISSRGNPIRYYEKNTLFDSMAPSIACKTNLKYVVGLLNSAVGVEYMKLMNPTVALQVGDVKKIPLIFKNEIKVNSIVDYNILLSKSDWDSFEVSWDFVSHPLVLCLNEVKYRNEITKCQQTIENTYSIWEENSLSSYNHLKSNEEELNRTFIKIYELNDELTPDIEDKDITIRKADMGREIRSLLSYAVGVTLGRYSLDIDGLAYAGGEWNVNKYSTIIPDNDNLLPISDDVYFEDDIVSKIIDFVKVVYGEETLEENLQFIADALSNRGDSSREVIRNYFLNDFFKDHLKIYQKRPIYWLFDSGKKNGFKALIYMHRYKPDLLATMRTDYVHEQQERYRTQLQYLEASLMHASPADQAKINKQIGKLKEQSLELLAYEEKIHHLADQMIDIDLDDGVKVNYAKFQDVLSPIK